MEGREKPFLDCHLCFGVLYFVEGKKTIEMCLSAVVRHKKTVVLECQRKKNEIISKTCNNHTFLCPLQV